MRENSQYLPCAVLFALQFAAGDYKPVALEAVEFIIAKAAIMRAEPLPRNEDHIGAMTFSWIEVPSVGELVMLLCCGHWV